VEGGNVASPVFSAGVMSGSSIVFPCRFAFTYSDDDLKAYSRLASARQDPGPDGGTFFGAMVALIIGLGLIVGLARQQGLIAQSALKPVLITTYASFVLGAAAYAFALQLGYRRIARRFGAYTGSQSCEIEFDVDGIRCRDRRYDVRASWQSVAEIRETDVLIVLWVGFRDGFVVPKRLFAEAGASTAFVAAARERVAAARSDRSAKEQDAAG